MSFLPKALTHNGGFRRRRGGAERAVHHAWWPEEAYELVAPILTKIAAVAEDGEPCVTYIGADGAGHYVKMVHNGIEYGDMQLIAEAYSLLKGGLNLSNEELAQTFTEWNNSQLSSSLIDITKDIFTKKDEDGNYLVDVIFG